MKNRNTIFTTAAEGMKKLTLALLVAAALNTPPAEAIFIPLSLQPGGPFTPGFHTRSVSGMQPAAPP